jgi:hypothetical protein
VRRVPDGAEAGGGGGKYFFIKIKFRGFISQVNTK